MLEDGEALCAVYKSADDLEHRKAALGRIGNADFLAGVVCSDDAAELVRTAWRKLKHGNTPGQNELAEMYAKCGDDDVKTEIFLMVDDSGALCKIFWATSNQTHKLAALDKITDSGFLVGIASGHALCKVAWERIKSLGLRPGQEELCGIVRGAADAQVWLEALDLIVDQQHLLKIVETPGDENRIREAAKRIRDKNMLRKILATTKDKDLIAALTEALLNDLTLKELSDIAANPATPPEQYAAAVSRLAARLAE